MPAQYPGDTSEANVMAGRAGYRIVEFAISMSPRAFDSSSASTFEASRLTIRGALVALLRFPGIELRAAPDERAA